jgi:hypothetical protein
MSLYCCVRMLSNELSLHYGVEFIGLAASEREMLREFVMAEGARADGVGQ